MQNPEFFAGGMTIFAVAITCVATLGPILLMAGIFYFIAKKNKERRQLVATGVPAQATIAQMGDTGVRINDQPRFSLVLDVHPAAGAPFAAFRTTHECTVPMMAMGRVAPGITVPVKCDPQNPTKLTIDWGQMGFMV